MNRMRLFKKKPVIIEAVQWTSNNTGEVLSFCNDAIAIVPPEGCGFLLIPTLEGDHRATPGDWIIRDVNGEFYPCKPDIFEKTYEEVHPEEKIQS